MYTFFLSNGRSDNVSNAVVASTLVRVVLLYGYFYPPGTYVRAVGVIYQVQGMEGLHLDDVSWVLSPSRCSRFEIPFAVFAADRRANEARTTTAVVTAFQQAGPPY